MKNLGWETYGNGIAPVVELIDASFQIEWSTMMQWFRTEVN